jgi:hypothetical protein
MGDRLANDGMSKLVKAYSTKYGAGRLRQRYFSGPGMDSPWDQRAGSVTLSNGQFFQRWVTPTGSLGTIPSDANRLVVVGWWFETNLAQAADFTMTVETFDPTCTNLISTTSDSSADTRKRIWQIPYQGNCYRLGFEAVNIPSGSRTMYWNYYWEDADRDDADGPSLAEVEIP